MPRRFVLLFVLAPMYACAQGNGREPVDAGRVPGRDGGASDSAVLDTGADSGAHDAATLDDTSTPDDAWADDAFAPGNDAWTPPVDAGRDTGPVNLCAGVDCSSMVSGCNRAACDTTTGMCVITTAPDGSMCDDGNRCTTGDTCHGVACVGTALDCSGMTTTCATATCNGSTGACQLTPVANGTACGATGTCASSACMAGACVMGTTAADCAACGTGSYCASGACGANPTTLSQGFESGAFPTGWTNAFGGTTAWRLVASGAHAGTYRAQSGAIGNSGTSGVAYRFTLARTATLSFWMTTSSEAGYDFLHVFVDGIEAGSWAGTTAWTQVSLGLGAGMHTIEWRYTKDAATVAGSDAVWIDDITLTSPAPASSLDFEPAALPRYYTTGGSLPWILDTTTPHGGARNAASGAIIDDQTTSLFTTAAVSTATNVSFWYRVSSEAGYDYFDVYVDGTRQVHAAGTIAWTMASYPLAVGTHVIEWRYTKDANTAAGSDRAWVDDVVIGGAPTTGGLCP